MRTKSLPLPMLSSVASLAVLLLTLSAPLHAATVLFQEDFNNTTASGLSANSVGWSAYYAVSGADAGSTLVTVIVQPTDYIYWNAATANLALAKTGLSLSNVGTISWLMNAAKTGDSARLMIQTGGNWYASNTLFTPAIEAVAPSNTVADTFSFDFTTNASAWRTIGAPGSANLAVGSALTSDLSLSTITGVGFFLASSSPGSSANMRFDSVIITEAVPEPGTTAAMVTGGVCMLVWAQSRRRRMGMVG